MAEVPEEPRRAQIANMFVGGTIREVVAVEDAGLIVALESGASRADAEAVLNEVQAMLNSERDLELPLMCGVSVMLLAPEDGELVQPDPMGGERGDQC